MIRSVSQGLAYALFDTDKSFPAIGDAPKPSMMEKNLIVELWHALNRETPYRERLVPNDSIDKAIAYTLAWLRWYRNDGHVHNDPPPEWGREYNPAVRE